MEFYPRAGLDITLNVLFLHITDWYYMYSQPRSKFGSLVKPSFERPDFLVRETQA